MNHCMNFVRKYNPDKTESEFEIIQYGLEGLYLTISKLVIILFNYYFSDTSYLSQAFDSVTSALTDLSSQLSATNSVEFDYIVQKWLGALGSVGVDSGTLTNLASAINALGTGQVDYLSSNSTAQNLLVLAANRVGLDYGQMLLDGVSSTDVNTLLYGNLYICIVR